jgi:hypothetical protein
MDRPDPFGGLQPDWLASPNYSDNVIHDVLSHVVGQLVGLDLNPDRYGRLT